MRKVQIIPENIELTVADDQTILDAALEQKLNLPHGCKNGDCAACKCKIASGRVKLGPYKKSVLTDEEINQGYTLLCSAYPQEEVVLEIPNLLNSFPIKTLPTKVAKIEKLNNIAILTLRLPPTANFGFYAGQYIDIVANGKNRSYSIASSPTQTGELEIHVRYYKGGVFSEFVWNELKEQQILRFTGPLGNFQLSKSECPVIMVCTGTGFAPIKAILQDMAAKNIKRKVHVYWGNRALLDYYMLDILYSLQQQLDFSLKLCLSGEEAEGFTKGHVTEAILNDYTDLSDYEIYACGNLQMIEDVYEISSGKLGLLKQNFFSDAFTPSAV